MRGLVSVFLFQNEYVIHSNSKTINWLWIASEPYYHLPIDSSAFEIGCKIKDALNHCQFDIPHPKQNEWNDLAKKDLSLKGFKTLAALHKTVSLCTLTYSDNELLIELRENRGAKNGFFVIKEITISKNDKNYSFENTANLIIPLLKELINK